MGNVTDENQDAQDAQQLRALAELMPCYRRHLSHHLRNSLSAFYCDIELSIQIFDSPEKKEALRQALYRMKECATHMLYDISRSGL